MTDMVGWITTAIAIVGVLANNRRLRWCFPLWLVSNVLSLALHTHADLWPLAVRDAVFAVLAILGWFQWGKEVTR